MIAYRRRLICLLFLALFALNAAGQTPNPPPVHSYLQPGDSLWYELTLVSGDVLTWTLWLSAVPRDPGKTVLTFRSDAEGEMWKREFDGQAVELREDIKIKTTARYRLTVFTTGDQGRPASLAAWGKYAAAGRAQFPLPETKRIAESFTAGDLYAVEFEFLLGDTTRFETLLGLNLPLDLVKMWGITPLGDSLTATATTRRWLGEGGTISLRERTPKGGRVTLRLELDIPENGIITIFIAPGSSSPAWLPSSARMVVLHKHDPWRAVIVPPQSVIAESLAAKTPESPRSMFAAQQLRVGGVDPETAERLLPIIAERDSLVRIKHERRKTQTGYDTLFLRGSNAFLPPDMHYTLLTPLASGMTAKGKPPCTVVSWFVTDSRGAEPKAAVYEWRYEEARVAFPGALDERFWDPAVLPLKPDMKTHAPATAEKPATVTIPTAGLQPLTVESRGKTLNNFSRSVWGLYLDNQSSDTAYLVFHRECRVTRPMLSLARWPKAARYTALILLIVVAIGGAVLYQLRRREWQRKKERQALEEELEKARSTQLKLLPNAPLDIENLHILGLHQSMQSVGGDYYDFFAREDGSILLCVADVTGHGYKAALIMSNVQATLRAVALPGRHVGDIASLLNLEVHKRTNPEDFVTFIVGEISADRKWLSVCNAGHNPGYLVKPSGQIIELMDGGIMLGALDMFPFTSTTFALESGDMIVFYTDGIPEATINKQGEMYGYERLKLFLAEHRYNHLGDIARKLIKQVVPDDTQPIEDDMAIVIARVDGTA